MAWMDRDSSSGGSKVRASLERFRWGEIVVLVVILLVSYVGLGHAWDRRQYLPKVSRVCQAHAYLHCC